jgi:predicted permease
MMNTLGKNLLFALRLMRKNPTFTLAAVASLALGIGANTAIFTIVNSLLLDRPPVERPEELISIFTTDGSGDPWGATSYPDFVALREETSLLSEVVAYALNPLSLGIGTGDERPVAAERVSGNYFAALGVSASHGRLFTAADERQGEPVAVISHRFWQRWFQGQEGVLGEVVRLNGRPFSIVGVAPEGFRDTFVGVQVVVWIPLETGTRMLFGADRLEDRNRRELLVLGRLRGGATLEQAEGQLRALGDRLAEGYPASNEERTLNTMSMAAAGVHPGIRQIMSVLGLLLSLLVGVVLLIACINLANLFLVRASARQQEISIRLALGAKRRQLVSQLLTESVLIALCGGVAGLLIAFGVLRVLNGFKPPGDFPVSLSAGIDATVLFYTLGLSVVTGIVFGLIPALRASRPDLVPALKGEVAALPGRYRRLGLRNLLVVAQVAISLVLLITSGLFVRSLSYAQHIDPGFDSSGVLLAPLDLTGLAYGEEESRNFYRRALERVAVLPGVEAVSVAEILPLSFPRNEAEVEPPRSEAPPEVMMFNIVAPGYFKLMGIELVAGRDFEARDRSDSTTVAVVNETMAAQLWPGEEALGESFVFDGTRAEVIAVVRDMKYRTLGEGATPFFYMSIFQEFEDSVFLHVKSRQGQLDNQLGNLLRTELRNLDPHLPLLSIESLQKKTDFILLPARIGAWVTASFGLVALILAATGIYGVMAYSVDRRRREMAIRMALGAEPNHVLRLVIGESVGLVLVGTLIGTLIALPAMRLIVKLLYGISAADPITFLGIALIMLTVAFLASYIPGRRATQINPMTALRAE